MTLRHRALSAAKRYASVRPPSFTIGPKSSPQLERWWLIPRNRLFNVYLHRFNRSDEDRALHDHPWLSLGWVLGPGGYSEILKATAPIMLKGAHTRRWCRAGSWTWRLPTTAHRVVLPNSEPVYTLFLTGPVVREWGFHCPNGWRHWKEFLSVYPGGNSTGRGCG